MAAPGFLGPGAWSGIHPGSGSGSRNPRSNALGQVDHEDVDRPPGEERAGHRKSLVRRARFEHDEPLQVHAPGHGLDRVQAPGKVHPGSDRAAGLGRRHELEGQGRPAARGIAAQGDRRITGDATRPEDRVEGGETRPDHPVGVGRLGPATRERLGLRLGCHGEGSDHPRSGRSPARPKGCKSGRDVRREARHGPTMIEQMFCIVNVETRLRGGPRPAQTLPQRSWSMSRPIGQTRVSPMSRQPWPSMELGSIPSHAQGCAGIGVDRSR